MINIGIIADFTDMDRVMGRLMSAMDEKRIHRVASKIARHQILKDYKDRWAELSPKKTRWQSRKKALLGVGPGFLTGTTIRSITDEYDEHMGRVFLAGRWPQGSGGKTDEWGHSIEWGSFGLRVKSNPRGLAWEYPSEDLTTKVYGQWREEGPIEWLYLDDKQIQVINDALSTSLDVAVGDVQGGGRTVKDVQIESIIKEAETQQRMTHTEAQAGSSGRYETSGALSVSEAEPLGEGAVIEGYKGQKQAIAAHVDVMSEIVNGVGKDIGQAAKDELAEWVKKHGKEFGYK